MGTPLITSQQARKDLYDYCESLFMGSAQPDDDGAEMTRLLNQLRNAYMEEAMPSPGMYDQTAAAKSDGLPNAGSLPRKEPETLAEQTYEHHQRIESLENLTSVLAQKIDALEAECAQLRHWVALS